MANLLLKAAELVRMKGSQLANLFESIWKRLDLLSEFVMAYLMILWKV
ncbi:hypothetical protein ACHAXS_011974 [Conticribra weissflogii]